MHDIAKRIFQSLSNHSSPNYRIASGFLIVGFFVFLGKLSGAAKEIVIAYRYGVGDTSDAYVFIFNLVSCPAAVWFSVVIAVLVPLTAKIRHADANKLTLFYRELTGITLAAAIFIGVAVFLCLPPLLKSELAGLSSSVQRRALVLAGPLTLLLPLGLLSSLFSAWLMACGHRRNTLLEAVPGLAIVLALLLLWNRMPEPLAWGSVIGFSLQLSSLCWTLRRVGELRWPTLGFQSSVWHDFIHHAVVIAAGQILITLAGILDQFFAAHLGDGAISALSYANRIVTLFISLGSTSISRAALPVFSEVSVKEDIKRIKQIVGSWARLMFFIGATAAAALWWCMPFIIRASFQRGAFTEADANLVSAVSRYFLFQIPIYLYLTVLVTAAPSVAKHHSLLSVGVIYCIAKPASLFFLTKLIGINAMPVSAIICCSAASFYLTLAINKHR